MCKRCLWLFALLGLATAEAGEFSLGLSAGSTSGDKHRRDELAAFRQGVAASYSQGQGLQRLAVEFLPTGEGKLQLASFWGEKLRLVAELERDRGFSDTSTYPERTPGGTPVTELYPFTNTLQPAFGDLEPVLARNRFRATLTYGRPWQGVAFWVTGFQQAGERTATVGGMAFGEAGAPAFFPASLAKLDSNRFEAGLAGFRASGPWWARGEVRAARFSSDHTALLPTYGRAVLLDVTALREKNRADEWRAAVVGGYAKGSVSVVGSASYQTLDTTPGFASGVRPGQLVGQLAAASGSTTRKAGALAATARPLPWLTVRLGGRVASEEREAEAQERFFAPAAGSSASKWDEASGKAELLARTSWAAFRLAGTVASGSDEFRATHGLRFASYTADLSRTVVAGELRLRLPEGFQVTLSGKRQRRERNLDLKELLFGYVLGDSVSRAEEVRAEVGKRFGGLEARLVLGGSSGKDSWQPPFYDPIYDPSWELATSAAKVHQRQATLQLQYAASDSFSVWLDGGYRKADWNFDAVTFPGFWWVDDRLEGWSAGLGGSLDLSPRSHLQLSASFDAPRGAVAHRWYWADASFVQDLRKGLAVFARAFTRRFSETRYGSDDFTLKALSLGIKGTL